MTPLQNLTVEQLRKVVAIKEQIETLEGEIEAIAVGGGSAAPETASVDDETPARGQGRGVYKRSAAMRARMAAAQKARWAGLKGGAGEGGPEIPKRRGRKKMSFAERGRIAAAARWGKLRAAEGASAPKKKSGFSAAHRAALAAAQKARWARARAAGKNRL